MSGPSGSDRTANRVLPADSRASPPFSFDDPDRAPPRPVGRGRVAPRATILDEPGNHPMTSPARQSANARNPRNRAGPKSGVGAPCFTPTGENEANAGGAPCFTPPGENEANAGGAPCFTPRPDKPNGHDPFWLARPHVNGDPWSGGEGIRVGGGPWRSPARFTGLGIRPVLQGGSTVPACLDSPASCPTRPAARRRRAWSGEMLRTGSRGGREATPSTRAQARA